ncbi:hypothetical protein N869_00380, partial [Cellulomonas bogoriensis 69B4 = DSM 16987]
MENLLGGPPPTLLPSDHADVPARAELADGADVRDVVPRHPAACLLWALLAEAELTRPGGADPIAAYAYARTGYHRGLDA